MATFVNESSPEDRESSDSELSFEKVCWTSSTKKSACEKDEDAAEERSSNVLRRWLGCSGFRAAA